MSRLSPTLLDSFHYYIGIEDDDRAGIARGELLARLRGEKTPPNEAMQKGIDFESNVWHRIGGTYHHEDHKDVYTQCVEGVADLVCSCMPQVHVERELDGVLLHGWIDALGPNVIYDIKTTSRYAIGKYLKNHQHRVYLYCLEGQAPFFSYLVSDFRNIYKEDYAWKPSYKDDLKSSIARWFDYLDTDLEMLKAWEQKQIRDAA